MTHSLVRGVTAAFAFLLTSCTGRPLLVHPAPTAPPTASWPTKPDKPSAIQIPVDYSYSFPLDSSKTSICLSGGGYRAALFHLGVLWRLNEAGQLSRAGRIVGVSGGAITAAVVGANWTKLHWVNGVADNFVEEIAKPILTLTSHTIDVDSLVIGVLSTASPSHELARSFGKFLFTDHQTLQSFPVDPQIILLSTDMRTGTPWRFARHAMGSDGTGYFIYPNVELSVAVAASDAYPPVLAPLSLDVDQEIKIYAGWTPQELTDAARQRIFHWVGAVDAANFDSEVFAFSHIPNMPPVDGLHEGQLEQEERDNVTREAQNRAVYLEDGGVLSNTGFELCTQSPRFIISSAAVDPARLTSVPGNWVSTMSTTFDLIYSRAETAAILKIPPTPLPARELALVDCTAESRDQPCGVLIQLSPQKPTGDQNDPHELAKVSIPTRLKKLDQTTQQHLVNWGYLAANSSAAIPFKVARKQDLPFPQSDYRAGPETCVLRLVVSTPNVRGYAVDCKPMAPSESKH